MQNYNEKFKIEIKKRAYLFALDIIKFVSTLNYSDPTIRIICDQLLRSATSIGANIIEAQAASSRNDFRNFINHALKSANETKFWLALLRDSGKADHNRVNKLIDEAIEIANILASSIITLKGRK